MLNIDNNILTWAITRAGYSQWDFHKVYPKAIDWLEDRAEPTLPQLRDFAKKVNLPFGYLFLETPPIEEIPIPLFRTKDGKSKTISLNLSDTIHILKQRQDWLREYFTEEAIQELDFVGKFTETSDVALVVDDIRETLGLNKEWSNQFNRWEDALKEIADKVEEIGIFLVFNSVVGFNNSRPIQVEECRGFVLSDTVAPFMFVNSADSKSAQLFTIVHELAHLWIGESAAFDYDSIQPANVDTERFCDAVAAEFLVPADLLKATWNDNFDFKQLARRFKVSPIVVARRAMDLNLISRDDFFSFYNEHMAAFKNNKSENTGGDFYPTVRRKLGLRFLLNVNRALKENKLLYKHAYSLTGLKGDTYFKTIKELNL